MLRYNRVHQAAPSAWLLCGVRQRHCDWRKHILPLRDRDRRKRDGLQKRVRVATGTSTADRVVDRGRANDRARLALIRLFTNDHGLLPTRRPSGGAVLVCRRESRREEIRQRPRRGNPRRRQGSLPQVPPWRPARRSRGRLRRRSSDLRRRGHHRSRPLELQRRLHRSIHRDPQILALRNPNWNPRIFRWGAARWPPRPASPSRATSTVVHAVEVVIHPSQ
jgi:hypothetical protein